MPKSTFLRLNPDTTVVKRSNPPKVGTGEVSATHSPLG